MAKGISSGYVPLGGVGCTDDIMAPVEIFQHIHTYGNHPVSCAAGLKSLEILQKENLIQRSYERGVYFLERLRSLEHHAIVGEVRGTGLWTAIDLTTNKKTKAPFPMGEMSRLVRRGREKGVILKFMGPSLEFAPPLTISEEEIDEGIRAVDECLAEQGKDMDLT
jgi:adenosylmethionine-8-amino-7-oxononanoate aminotransferase